MITKEEFEKAVEYCASDTTDCNGCPLCASDKQRVCSTYLAEYITKNELAPAATGTSSEVSKDTSSTHLDDSILLNICQEELEEISKIALDDYPNEFLTGYIEAFKDNIRRLRGGDGNGQEI